MGDFADTCIATYKEEEEDRANERRRRVKNAFYSIFLDNRFVVAEDAMSVTIQGLVIAASVNNDGVDFSMSRACPNCHSLHIYYVASRSDVGRVLSMTSCSDCRGR